MHPYLQVFLVSLTPIGELRASIPLGILVLNLPWIPTVLISILGNLIPATLILFLFDFIDHHFKRNTYFNKLYMRFVDHSEKKSKTVRVLGYIGLAIFIGIPIPGTGAWTGAFIAGLLSLKKLPSFISIISGVLLAATIVILTSIGILKVNL